MPCGDLGGKKTMSMLRLNKDNLNRLISVLTAHSALHQNCIGAVEYKECYEYIKTMKFFLCDISAFVSWRLKYLEKTETKEVCTKHRLPKECMVSSPQ